MSTFLPKADYKQSPLGTKRVVTFELHPLMPVERAETFRYAVEDQLKLMDTDLVVVDVRAGEPVWLCVAFEFCASAGFPIFVDGDLDPTTRAAWCEARATNTIQLAEALGYETHPADKE